MVIGRRPGRRLSSLGSRHWRGVPARATPSQGPHARQSVGQPTCADALKDFKLDSIPIRAGFDLAKLTEGGWIATGEVTSAPVGMYAKEALEKLGAWHAAAPKFVMTHHVRAALTLVAVGEAQLGIVYSTDAKVSPDVRIIGTFPAYSHSPIVYPVAATVTAKPEAVGYIAYLCSKTAKTIFEQHGFRFLIQPTS